MYQLYDNIPLSSIIIDCDNFNIEYINKEFLNAFKIDRCIVGLNIKKIDLFNKVSNYIEICIKDKMSKKVKKVNLLQNRYFDLNLFLQEDKLVILIYEVTEYAKKEAQVKNDREKILSVWSEMKAKCDIIEQLRRKEKEYLLHLKDVVNNLSEGLVVLDRFWELDFCNEAALKIMELDIKEVAQYKELLKDRIKILYNYSNYDENLEEFISHHIEKSKTINNLIIEFKSSREKIKYILINSNSIENKEGKLQNTIITMKDVTDEIMHNKEREEVSKMKDEFFNVISHELRTPLTIIYASLQLANDIYHHEITENLEKILSRINQNSRRLLKMINNILDISKAEKGFLEPIYSSFDIVEFTESLVSSANFYANSRGIDLIFDTSEEEVAVVLDKDKYEKIVLNLISNAIKFTPESKKIFITTNIEKDYFELIVKDEGIGIPEDKLSLIFDKFVQVNNSFSKESQGTGLGLALVKNLVDLMEGTIKVSSELGKGTEFIIRFNYKELPCESVEDSNKLQPKLNNKIIIEFAELA